MLSASEKTMVELMHDLTIEVTRSANVLSDLTDEITEIQKRVLELEMHRKAFVSSKK